MDIRDKEVYPVPVGASKGPGGTAISPRWKIIFRAVNDVDDIRPFFVRENDHHCLNA